MSPPKRGIGAYQPGDGGFAGLAKGKNYLLAIGIDAYQHFPALNNAVRDAQSFAALLQERYQFEAHDVEVLFNEQATERNLLHKLRDMARLVTPDDNLVIYFSGHGEFDEVFKEGYWIPVDAEPDALEDFIPNSKINTVLNAIRSRHTFLVIDSCFSGSLFMQYRSGAIGGRLEALPSRWGLTSGRNEVVPDGPVGQHSPFAESLLSQLRLNQTDLGVAELCQRVVESVAARSRQIPRGEPLRVEGHEGGQFFFRLRQSAHAGSDLQPQTMGARPSRGGLLYSIPRTMEVGQESRCEVRIAYDKSILLEDFNTEKEHAVRDIRISNLMQVELLDPGESAGAFAVRTITSAEQFIDPDDYTEWIFYVKALQEGLHPLALKVTVIENLEGRERRREIVLEEKIDVRSQLAEIPEPSAGFTAGYSFALAAPQYPAAGVYPESPPPQAPFETLIQPMPAKKEGRKYRVSTLGWVRALAAAFAIVLGVMVVFRFFINTDATSTAPTETYYKISEPLAEARKSLEMEEPDIIKAEEHLKSARRITMEQKEPLPDTLRREIANLEGLLERKKMEKPALRELEQLEKDRERERLANRIKSGSTPPPAGEPPLESFTDQRDGKSYAAIMQAKRFWLQSNLAYQTDQATCYENRPLFCENFGALYTWEAARRACPPGWRLPSAEDWDGLVKTWGGYKNPQTFEAMSFGGSSFFQARMGGRQDPRGVFIGLNEEGLFWTDTPIDARSAQAVSFVKKEQSVRRVPVNKNEKLSCRCIRD